MWKLERRACRLVLFVFLLGAALVGYNQLAFDTSLARQRQLFSYDSPFSSERLTPANSTLGFGAVLAVSRAASPRRESLLLAANITEIDVTIPIQPKWTDEEVSHLRADRDSRISRGSALAWLGHLNALRWFLASDLETVLILEDDVDWDIHLRTVQIPAAAAAVRQLVQNHTTPPGDLQHNKHSNNFWGNSSAWDILYLGHCGDIFRPDQWTSGVPHTTYPDTTLPARHNMHPYTSYFLDVLAIPPTHRLIHQSIFPLCTFAFAVTRPAAHRLLHEIAPKEAEGGTHAYDVRILEACRDHGFRCWSANPEFFHHLDIGSEIAIVDSNAQVADTAATGPQAQTPIAKAPNIACGARRKRFFTRDNATMEYLREVVGRQGVCLSDPDEREEEDGRREWRLKEGGEGEDDQRPGDPRMYI